MILVAMLVVIVTVQVLPQVDLPDTAFHEDTAPVLTKFRALSAPVAAVIARSIDSLTTPFSRLTAERSSAPVHLDSRCIPILLCCLTC